MYEIRYYNERIEDAYDEGRNIPSGIHGSMGQEASAVGVCEHLRDDDWAFASHRSSHVALAKGSNMRELIAEQLGREGGICDGKAGEQHILDEKANFVSGAIVAQHLPSTIGVALAHKKRNNDNVAVGFIGEGAANQGAFYECLNFASVFDLPVLFVIEDNEWGISTPKTRVTAVEDNSKRAEGQNMPGKRIEHNDPVTIYEEAGEAIDRARNGDGPTLLEIKTYRFQGHFFEDPEDYRNEVELNEMKENDCMYKITKYVNNTDMSESEIATIESDIEDRVDEAVEYALDQPWPNESIATKDVFFRTEESHNYG
jgi:pyruvate dehydrogenase E1 component alpha subunit